MINFVKRNPRLAKLENYLLKKMGRAMMDYEMTSGKDRILACVSGGKDSMAMLRLLLLKNRQLPADKKFHITALHVKFDTCDYDITKLEEFFKECEVEYHIEKAHLPENTNKKLSGCFWCSWNRRKFFFRLAQKFSCTRVALAHHLDDIAETLLMNQFYYGEISTMPPNVSLFEGELNIIRPLAYIAEKSIIDYATSHKMSFFTCTCPHSTPDSRRKYIKALIKELEKKCSYVKINLFRSMRRIKPKYLT